MPDEPIDPPPSPPENPATAADILPFCPVSYEYGKRWGLVLTSELAVILEEKQAENPCQFLARPVELVDGRWFLSGDIMTEVPHGLYAATFAALDVSRFDEIIVLPIDDAIALLPVPEEL